jgi:ABC-2 type transport system ATP-binding protein
VFLTTQYLEEADQLADRVGIIASGELVAEGTPSALKAEVGQPHLEVCLVDERAVETAREVLSRFGEQRPPAGSSHISVGLADGAAEIAPVVIALSEADVMVASLELVEPTLDDVFMAKTGHHLEGAAGGGDEGEGEGEGDKEVADGGFDGAAIAAAPGRPT